MAFSVRLFHVGIETPGQGMDFDGEVMANLATRADAEAWVRGEVESLAHHGYNEELDHWWARTSRGRRNSLYKIIEDSVPVGTSWA